VSSEAKAGLVIGFLFNAVLFKAILSKDSLSIALGGASPIICIQQNMLYIYTVV
jgi:hypothetical protein